jgi:hypothetical protein
MMTKLEEKLRKNGPGELVLKNGTHKQVTWDAEFLRKGLMGHGLIRGNKKYLKAAAKDGCAILHPESDVTAAIAIDHYENGEASFTTLLISSTPPIFCAQTILGSSPVSDSTKYSIEFSDANGELLRLIVPRIIMWDFLPVAFHQLEPFSVPGSSTSFCRMVKTVHTGTTRSFPFVCVSFNNDQPLVLPPEKARQLAEELNELAEKVESRAPPANH